jgi:hypothetical protein
MTGGPARGGLGHALLLGLAGCGSMSITGEVVDAAGAPVPGARVTAAGTPCHAQTDAAGRFSLPCQPGDHTVVIAAEGYTSVELQQAAPETQPYDTGKHLLVKIPDSKGLHLFSGTAYAAMKPGRLQRLLREQGRLTHRAVCLDPARSEPNELPAGAHQLFDYEHPGWRPFKLDAEGCAYRDTKNEKHQWSVEYREKAEVEVKALNEGKSIATLQLEPGDYFIADWQGFFVGADEKEERFSYTGHWLRVR